MFAINSNKKFDEVKILVAACLWLIVTTPQSLAQVGSAQAGKRAKKATSVEWPEVRWDVDWAITRTRPGYPLLKSTAHFVVQPPRVSAGAYHHHAQIAYEFGKYWATWSNHPLGEDGPGQKVVGAVSENGRQWRPLGTVFEPCDDVDVSASLGRSLLASPFVRLDERVFAVAVVSDTVGFGPFDSPVTGKPVSAVKTEKFRKRIRRPHGYLLRELFADGSLGSEFWLGERKPTPQKGMRAFVLPDGLSSAEMDRLRQSFRDPITLSPWAFGEPAVEVTADGRRLLCEPTTQRTDDGLLIRYRRDLSDSQKLFVQFSKDEGANWSPPQRTAIPDAPAKSIFGRLPDGRFFLIGNQVVSKRGTRRDPLTIGVSKNGTSFKAAYAIRWRTPKFQVPNQQDLPDGRGRGFQYPAYVVVGQSLWVIYSVNKESIHVTRIAIDELVP